MNINEKSRKEYISRIYRVVDYIEKHIDTPLNLNTLAKIAYFSPFHFHRIFTVTTGETPSAFVQRIRVEKAAYFLQVAPEMSISKIAYQLGFDSVSLFSRTFVRILA